MSLGYLKEIVEKIEMGMNMEHPRQETYSVDICLPLIEKMRSEGAVILLKWDGERGEGDNGPYTALVSRNLPEREFFRTDAASMEDALAHIIVNYARQYWIFEE